MTNIFTLSSVLWTMILTLLLYSIVGMKKPLRMHPIFHILCWGIPIIVTFIPLSNSTYGPPGGQVSFKISFFLNERRKTLLYIFRYSL